MENIKYCKQGRSKIILELCLANTEDNCTREVCAAENEILNMPGTTEAQVCLTQQDDYGTCPENDVLSELFLNEIVVAPLGDTVLASTSANGMQGEDNRVPINLLNTCTMDVIATDFVNECANDMRGLPSTSQVEVELSEAYSDSGSSYAPPSSTTSSSDNDQILKSNRRSNTTNPETSQHKKDIGVQGKSNLGISIHKGKHTIKRKARNSRKRTRNPDTWHKNVNKRKKTAGEEYINYKKVAVPAKRMLSPCGDTCRRKCRDHFPEEIRENIFQDFYKLSLGNQQQFILLHVKESDKNVQRLRRDADTPSLRNFTKRYNLKKTV